jgi:predicted RNA-binding Zn ribbon-like protein
VRRDALITGEVQPGGRAPAFGELRLVQDFVNTRHEGLDAFDGPAGLNAWLGHRGLTSGAGDADLRHAVELREALRALLAANHAGGDTELARVAVDAAAARAGLRADFGAERPRLVPAAAGVDGALGHVAAVAFAAMLDGSWARLKACARCGWAFYDRSSNRRAAWCSMQVCGNRAKAASYHRRHR